LKIIEFNERFWPLFLSDQDVALVLIYVLAVKKFVD